MNVVYSFKLPNHRISVQDTRATNGIGMYSLEHLSKGLVLYNLRYMQKSENI